jgi:hypothetical protein
MDVLKLDYRDQLLEKIKEIDTTDLSDDVDKSSIFKVIEEQKIYFWIRLYIKEVDLNTKIGDIIEIKYLPSGEKLDTTFICYGKKGLEKDHNDEVTNYNPEDDQKVICLMIDQKMVDYNDDIPFIRSLFKTGIHYEYQLIRRDELLFSNKRSGFILDYYDCDF